MIYDISNWSILIILVQTLTCCQLKFGILPAALQLYLYWLKSSVYTKDWFNFRTDIRHLIQSLHYYTPTLHILRRITGAKGFILFSKNKNVHIELIFLDSTSQEINPQHKKVQNLKNIFKKTVWMNIFTEEKISCPEIFQSIWTYRRKYG